MSTSFEMSYFERRISGHVRESRLKKALRLTVLPLLPSGMPAAELGR
jgi:hypothetical protein